MYIYYLHYDKIIYTKCIKKFRILKIFSIYQKKQKVFINICLKIINFGIFICLLVLMRKWVKYQF